MSDPRSIVRQSATRLLGMVAPVLALLATAGCTVPATQVIVITDTPGFDVPAEVDELRIEVTAPSGEVQTASAYLETPGALPPPRALTLVHDGGLLGPFRVRAIARVNDVDVVERVAVFEFQPERLLALRIDLTPDCAGRACSAGMTCEAGSCRAEEIAANELEPFDGVIPTVDAGPPQPQEDAGPPTDGGPQPDAGDCTAEVCNEADDDCDDAIDEDFDLTIDTSNCGSCGNACGSGEACVDGACVPSGCPTGFADCNGSSADGCETMLGTDLDCGGCGDRCTGGRMCCPPGVCQRGAC